MAMLIETHTLVVYDIENDRIRTRIGNICLDFGMLRFQKSTFWGKLNSNRRKELYYKLKDSLKDSPGRILIQPISIDDVEQRFVIANEKQEEKNPLEPSDPAKPKNSILKF